MHLASIQGHQHGQGEQKHWESRVSVYDSPINPTLLCDWVVIGTLSGPNVVELSWYHGNLESRSGVLSRGLADELNPLLTSLPSQYNIVDLAVSIVVPKIIKLSLFLSVFYLALDS